MAKAYRFDGKVAVVTGAGLGLGRAHAFELARRGSKVIVNDYNLDAANAATAAINAAFGEVAFSAIANVASEAGAKKIIETALEKFGQLDILVNNAGICSHGNFLEIPRSEFDRIMDVNVRGTWEVTRAAWPHMIDRKYGRVLMTTSAAGLYGQPAAPEYSASKAADFGLAMSLAIEGAEHGIHVNALAPAAWTPQSQQHVPEGARDWFSTLKPEAVSQLVAWLVHEECRSNGELWGALHGIVVRYKLGCRTFSQVDFQAEDVSLISEELSDFSGNCEFDSNLAEHLLTLASKNGLSLDGKSFVLNAMTPEFND